MSFKSLSCLCRFVLILSLTVLITTDSGYPATVDETLKKIQNLSPAQRKAALEEGAKKERQIVFYTSMSLSDYPKIMAVFEKAYPYIKANTFRSTPSGVFRRVDTEARAGRYAVDVVGSASVETWQLKQRQLSMPYLSPERTAFPSGSYDPEGYWAAFEVTPIVLAFNTKMVSPHEAPQNYEDLLNPKWRGKMSLGTEEYEWFDVMLDSMGRKKGVEYMKALARQQLHMPGSSSVMRVNLMLAGESAIAIAARGRRVTEYKEKGAPIDFRTPDPYAAEPNLLTLMRRVSHPHAAILFFDWIMSDEGQSRISDLVGRISIRKGVKHQARIQELFQKEFVFVRPSSIGSDLNEIIELYHQIFGLHRSK